MIQMDELIGTVPVAHVTRGIACHADRRAIWKKFVNGANIAFGLDGQFILC